MWGTIMQNDIINFLDNTGIGIGTFIFFIVGAVVMIQTIWIKVIKPIIKYFKDRGRSEVLDETKEKQTNRKMNEYDTCIKTINTNIMELTEQFKTMIETVSHDREESKNETEKMKILLENHTESLNILGVQNKYQSELIGILIDSDKEEIKSFIVKEHSKWTAKGFIDINSFQAIESRYDKYIKENGNTFVAGLMKDIRSLKKVSTARKTKIKNNKKRKNTWM